MGGINFGIIGSACKDCSKTEELPDRIYAKQGINEILNEALELIGRQHEMGEMCDCEFIQAKKVLEFMGNQCIFCDNRKALIYHEVFSYIKKENPLKEDKKKELVKKAIVGSKNKVLYPKAFEKST